MLERKTSRTINKHGMLLSGDAVLVCVSGGPDSVCLLHILHSFSEKYSLKLSVCHVNHMLRGKESYGDEKFSEELARERNLPFYRLRKNVRLRARKEGISIEEAGRKTRYEFFAKTAKRHGINKIALGHNMDDRAETLLLNLMRGSGLDGMAGMPAARNIEVTGISIIRPLIACPRAQIEAFLERKGAPFRTDSSNLEPAYARNRLRLELIPFIERNFEPDIRQKLARTAAIMQEYRGYFNLHAGKIVKNMIRISGFSAEINLEDLRNLHPALKRAALQEAFSAAEKAGTILSSAHIEHLKTLAESKAPGGKLSLPSGFTAEREYERLIFRKNILKAKAPETPVPVRIPGKHTVSDLGIEIDFKVCGSQNACFDSDDYPVALDYQKIMLPANIRRRKAGDRFSPLGMTGTRKLKDFLIDRKIPQRDRDGLPVIADRDDNILCILLPGGRGGAVDNNFRVTGETKRVLKVRIV